MLEPAWQHQLLQIWRTNRRIHKRSIRPTLGHRIENGRSIFFRKKSVKKLKAIFGGEDSYKGWNTKLRSIPELPRLRLPRVNIRRAHRVIKIDVSQHRLYHKIAHCQDTPVIPPLIAIQILLISQKGWCETHDLRYVQCVHRTRRSHKHHASHLHDRLISHLTLPLHAGHDQAAVPS